MSLAVLYALAVAMLLRLKDGKPQREVAVGEARPFSRIVSQPSYLAAVLAGVVAYGMMSFIMTATPIQLHNVMGYGLEQTTWVIQSHIIAMYLPSLYSGVVIERIGVMRVMVVGVLCILACVVLGLIGHQFIHFWGALVLLGVGWNFLFVGGTVLLTQSYRPSERFAAQAANDLAIFGAQAQASLSAGTVLSYAGWEVLNLIGLPILLVALGAILSLRHRMTLAPSKA